MLCPYCSAVLDDVAKLNNCCSACKGFLGKINHTIRTLRLSKEIPSVSTNRNSTVVYENTSLLDAVTVSSPPETNLSSLPLSVRRFTSINRKASTQSPIDFFIQEKIGEGGMGRVEAMEQGCLQRSVAVKWLTNPEGRERFLNEAKIMGILEHPNIVPIYDLGIDESNNIFFAMRRIGGKTWAELLDTKSLPENIEILLAVCDAVAYAHSKGIIHRDLKPDNVMLGDYNEILVFDWGLAAGINDEVGVPRVAWADAIAGTPAYMAPEMAKGEQDNIGVHSDIYLLGAILFQLISGEFPHTGHTSYDCLKNAAKNLVTDVWLDSELMKTARKAMATNPRERFASVSELRTVIDQHSRSVIAATHARSALSRAEQHNSYLDYFRALGGFAESIEIWSDNKMAQTSLDYVNKRFADLAEKNGDHHLAAVLRAQIRDAPEENNRGNP